MAELDFYIHVTADKDGNVTVYGMTAADVERRVIKRKILEEANCLLPVAERKRGRWEDGWFDHKPKLICSACCCMSDRMTDFCPNCGAKMEVDK